MTDDGFKWSVPSAIGCVWVDIIWLTSNNRKVGGRAWPETDWLTRGLCCRCLPDAAHRLSQFRQSPSLVYSPHPPPPTPPTPQHTHTITLLSQPSLVCLQWVSLGRSVRFYSGTAMLTESLISPRRPGDSRQSSWTDLSVWGCKLSERDAQPGLEMRVEAWNRITWTETLNCLYLLLSFWHLYQSQSGWYVYIWIFVQLRTKFYDQFYVRPVRALLLLLRSSPIKKGHKKNWLSQAFASRNPPRQTPSPVSVSRHLV